MTVARILKAGVRRGLEVWGAYALVEAVFLGPVSTVVVDSFAAPDWRMTALLFAAYPALGAGLGALTALLLAPIDARGRGGDPLRWLTAILGSTPIVAGLSNLQTVWPFSPLTLFSGAVGAPFVAALWASALSRAWAGRLAFATHPLTIGFVVVAVPFTSSTGLHAESGEVKAMGGTAAVAVVLSVAYLVSRAAAHVAAGSASRAVGREVALYVGLASVLLLLSAASSQTPYEAETGAGAATAAIGRPNVILLTWDTVRADHLSAYGYERETTPNLEAMLPDATLYERAVATGDMTLPSHASMFTGLYPRQHGAHFDYPDVPKGAPLMPEFETLAETLARAGYLTLGVVANTAFLTRDFGFQQGFAYYDDRSLSHFLRGASEFYIRFGVSDLIRRFLPPEVGDRRFRPAEDVTKRAAALVERGVAAEAPFFLFVNYMDAHWPYIPPPPFDTRFPGKIPDFATSDFNALKRAVMTLERELSSEERAHLVSQYDGAIAYLDAQLGELIRLLKREGIYDETMIVLTSDHGEAFGERNVIEHAVSVHHGQVEVPLVIKYPGSVATGVVPGFASLVDIPPTVFAAADVDGPAGVSGRNLREPIDDERVVISEAFKNDFFISWHPRFDRSERALYAGSLKLIVASDGTTELYDVVNDVDETKDLSNERSEEEDRLRTRLDRWLVDVPQQAPAGQLGAPAIERLRELGYVR